MSPDLPQPQPERLQFPLPLRAGWRFWETGAVRAETSLHGQREVEIHATGDASGLPVELVLGWLISLVLTEAATD